MLTSKQRAKLRSIASTTKTIGQIGKEGLTEACFDQVSQALTAREIVKYRVLETCPEGAGEAAGIIAEKTGAQVVGVIGSRIILYRRNPDKPVIKL